MRKSVPIWGDGSPKREFLHVDDLAEACVHLMLNYNEKELVNIGAGTDISIAELAKLIKTVTGYEGELAFDPSKPNGTPRKWMDSAKLHALGFTHTIDLETGIRMTVQDFEENRAKYTGTASH